MRAKASQFVSLAALLLVVSYAFASSSKPAHKPVAARRALARPSHSARTAKLEPVKSKRGKPSLVRAGSSHRLGRAVASEPVRRRPAPIVRQAPEPAAEDDVQVTHNRKQHYRADPGADDAARKATPEDFLSSFEPRSAPAARAQPKRVAIVTEKPVVVVARSEPAPEPVLYRRGRLVVPPAMKGSHEILLRQNEMADRDGLDRVQDDADLEQMRADKQLVAIPAVAGLDVDERLPLNRRYCRPWTAQFLAELARAHYARFHTALQVNSAVRTVAFQRDLITRNGNAAPAEGETASPHLTGQAIDLGKHGLSMAEIAWLRGYLMPLVQAGKVDVEEEFQQACFHISVYRRYVPQAAPPRDIAQTHHVSGAALATAIR
jgi:hypothetical protein